MKKDKMARHGTVCQLTDLQKSDKYQRTLSLNFDCGSDTLRELIETELDNKGMPFKTYIKESNNQTKIKKLSLKNVLCPEQVNIINSKDPDCMDISLLTLILLELIPTTTSQKTYLYKLRKKRNELAHKPRAMLEDDKPFIEASQLIIDLSKEISTEFEQNIRRRIEELKNRELVHTRSSMDIIHLNNESLMVKLVDTGANKQVDGNNEIWIKLGLTKYVRQLARSLDVDVLLQELKAQGVISDTIKRRIEQIYNIEEQMQKLVLHMMNEDAENLLKFCNCLRKLNSLLADLVQHQTSAERDIALKLQAAEKTRLHDVIKVSFVQKEKSSIACEDVHIFIEEKQKCAIKFPIIQECIKECFPSVVCEENDSRFHEITWQDGTDFMSEEKLTEDEQEILTDMSCDKFGANLATKMEKVKEGIGSCFEKTASEECISAEIFAKLSDGQMEQLFSYRLKEVGLTYAFGIRSALSDIQTTIKQQMNRTSANKKSTLRKFDTPAENIAYTKSTVRPSSGNLLTAAHVFVCPVVQRQCNTAFLVKEVIRFALACINGKKNGTIHLGVKEAGNGNGEIVGLSEEKFRDVRILDEEISSGIKVCFDQKHHLMAERCIRPAQVIPVEDHLVVFEVDIVPFSGYIKKKCIQINYPPKGFQRRKCFLFREHTIYTIEENKLDSVRMDLEELFQERVHLEMKDIITSDNSGITKAKQKLTELLTGGNKYVTDAFVPIICSGDLSGCMTEEEIRENVSSMSTAFTSASAVIDFDSSVELRNGIENGNTYFQVKMAEDFSTKRSRRESNISRESNTKCIWLYSNGNEELGKGKMTSELWYANRLGGVQNALQQIRLQIPIRRGLVIFLVFQKPIEYDPMLEIARESFLTTFKDDECIVVADNDTILQEWRKEMKGKMTTHEFDSKVVTGLSWGEVAATVNGLFKPNEDVLFKFPDSGGHTVEMTYRERDKMQLCDIEFVDGYAEEHCRLQEKMDTDKNCRMKRSEEQEKLYKGNTVTWWNYYTTQVGKGDAYEFHKNEIEQKLSSTGSKNRYEIHHIEHNSGAEGSTVGRNLLWHFSQIGRQPEKAYRCCIVHRITENTADEIYRFQEFKEKCLTDAKPVIVLVDNKSEENVNMLKDKVDGIAYKKGSPGKLFCLLLIVTRVPVSHASRDNVIIHDNLSRRESMWFEKKSKEFDSNTDVKFNTFDVMRHSFASKYINGITQKLINTSSKEMLLLGYLSVVSSFSSDPVPETIFDSVMLDTVYDPKTLSLEQCMNKPFGIVLSEKERYTLKRVEREGWNVNLSDAMQSLITHRSIISDNCRPFNGVCILPQPLSRGILKYIMQMRQKTFQNMVNDLLKLVEQHTDETNATSKHFIKIVCRLFTSRESCTGEKADMKVNKFSPLVVRLEEQLENDTVESAQWRVIDVIKRCFKITGNATVGQQLARYYYIIMKKYAAAEGTIKRCLSQLPHPSYLLDTYGQIFKTKMEQMFASSNKADRKMINIDAAECIDLAYKAVERFKEAQEASSVHADNTCFNSNSFYMEVMTVLCLLENFHKFECFGDKTTFWKFLNEEDLCVEKSAYKDIVELAPALKTFRKGHETQHHLENSLRTLEDRAYIHTRSMTSVVTPSTDQLLLKLRETFEMFYGSKEHTSQFEFLYGVGIKLIMNAHKGEDSRLKLMRRVQEAEIRLQNKDSTEIERDLLVYLGYSIMEMSAQHVVSNPCLYRTLLNYSTNLWSLQQKKGKKDRRYVEAYLYYALLHWILPARTASEIGNLSHPETYKVLLNDWEDVFMENNYIKSREQLSKVQPRIFFALGNGKPGNDIVDLGWLRHLWRDAMLQQGRTRKEVKTDNHWHHPIFEDRLERLSGTVDSNGKSICTEVTYNKRDYTFRIRTRENFAPLSNKAVTFVLAFSWMSPVAVDVRKYVSMPERTMLDNEATYTEDSAFENSVYVASWSNMVRSGIDTVTINDSASQASNATTEKVGPSQEESADVWHTVPAKKKSNAAKKEPQRNKTSVASSSAAMSCPTQNFEEVIGKCKERFPHSSRDKLITAYNDVKSKHGGSVKGLSLENILEEIGKKLGSK